MALCSLLISLCSINIPQMKVRKNAYSKHKKHKNCLKGTKVKQNSEVVYFHPNQQQNNNNSHRKHKQTPKISVANTTHMLPFNRSHWVCCGIEGQGFWVQRNLLWPLPLRWHREEPRHHQSVHPAGAWQGRQLAPCIPQPFNSILLPCCVVWIRIFI